MLINQRKGNSDIELPTKKISGKCHKPHNKPTMSVEIKALYRFCKCGNAKPRQPISSQVLAKKFTPKPKGDRAICGTGIVTVKPSDFVMTCATVRSTTGLSTATMYQTSPTRHRISPVNKSRTPVLPCATHDTIAAASHEQRRNSIADAKAQQKQVPAGRKSSEKRDCSDRGAN